MIPHSTITNLFSIIIIIIIKYICTYIHIFMYTCFILTSMHTNIQSTYIHTYLFGNMHVYTVACLATYTQTHWCISAYVHIHAYNIHVWIF